MQTSLSQTDQPYKKNTYNFSIDKDRSIQISSDFECGNIALVKQTNQLNYQMQAVSDNNNRNSKRKSWFYFRVRAHRGIKIRFVLENVGVYQNMYQEGNFSPPFCREGVEGCWKQLSTAFLTYHEQVLLNIDYSFGNQKEVYFCLSIPFSYTQNINYLHKIKQNIPDTISYTEQILTESVQGKMVHMLTITEEPTIQKNKNKPIILITSRVHPGETSASFCLQGMLEFLLRADSLQSYILRKLFVFKIVPIVNVDGVIEGNYRMDTEGANLNRHYSNPSPNSHPAIFAINQFVKKNSDKLWFYFDLHAHSSLKQSFIYGNAFEDIVNQSYSEYFCKILQENCDLFKYSLCNFDERHMKHKDKGQNYSKEGCARVVVSKMANLINSYTVETSIFSRSYEVDPMKRRTLLPERNINYSHKGFRLQNDLKENEHNLILQNKKLGKSILISILDIIKKNPYSRFDQTFGDNYCKDRAIKLLQNEERFKLLDMKAYQKVRNLNNLIKINFEVKLNQAFLLSGVCKQFNENKWPAQFRKIEFSKELSIEKPTSIQKQKQPKKNKFYLKTQESHSMRRLFKTKLKQQKSHRIIEEEAMNLISETNLPSIKYSVQMKNSKIKKGFGPMREIQLDFDKKEEIDIRNTQLSENLQQEILKKKKTNTLKRAGGSYQRIDKKTNDTIDRIQTKRQDLNFIHGHIIRTRNQRIHTEVTKQIIRQENNQDFLKEKSKKSIKKINNKFIGSYNPTIKESKKIKFPEIQLKKQLNFFVSNSNRKEKDRFSEQYS